MNETMLYVQRQNISCKLKKPNNVVATTQKVGSNKSCHVHDKPVQQANEYKSTQNKFVQYEMTNCHGIE